MLVAISMTIHVKKGKSAAQQQLGERCEKVRNSSEGTKVSEAEEQGGPPGTKAKVFLLTLLKDCDAGYPCRPTGKDKFPCSL